jgi:hypothetical protein
VAIPGVEILVDGVLYVPLSASVAAGAAPPGEPPSAVEVAEGPKEAGQQDGNAGAEKSEVVDAVVGNEGAGAGAATQDGEGGDVAVGVVKEEGAHNAEESQDEHKESGAEKGGAEAGRGDPDSKEE